MEVRDAHALCVAAMLPVSIASAVLYILNGALPEWEIILQTMAGTLIGGYLGAKLLGKIQTIWLTRAFGAFLMFSAIRMIF